MNSFILSAQVLNVFKNSDWGIESRIALIDALRASTWGCSSNRYRNLTRNHKGQGPESEVDVPLW